MLGGVAAVWRGRMEDCWGEVGAGPGELVDCSLGEGCRWGMSDGCSVGSEEVDWT